MPAARVAFLSLFALLFAAAWSNDDGLRAAPISDRPRLTISREPGIPSVEPAGPRPNIAEVGDATAGGTALHPGALTGVVDSRH